MAARPATLVVLADRRCARRALDNPVRRWLAPAHRDVERLDPPAGATVADLGSGVGFHVPELLRRIGGEGRLYLVDPDAANLAIAAGRAPGDPRVTVRASSAARIDGVPDASVDRALLSFVLCCIVDKEAALDETWRILRPGGRALATYPRFGVRWRRPSRSLRVTPERWAALRARKPWVEHAVPRGRWVEHHLLEKPTLAFPSSPAAVPPATDRPTPRHLVAPPSPAP